MDQVNSDLLQLRTENFALFDTPREPVAMLVLFISRPLRSADSDEERLVGPRLSDPLDQSEGPTHTVLQALTTILVSPVIGNRGEE